MHKYIGLILILTFFCCNQNTLENDIATIDALHKKAKKNVNDSTLLYIRQAKALIDNNNKLPDTLKIENIFRKGYYFLQTEKLDSASYYFHRAIDLVKAPNTRKRNLVYFRNTWETDEKIDNLTNAISAAQKFIDISNEEENNDDLIYAYNCLDRVHLELGSYQKSLNYNDKASKASLKAGKIDMYVITNNAKAYNLYYYMGKRERAFNLLDSLKTIDCGTEAKRQLNRTYGILSYFEGNYDKAIENYKLVIDLSKKTQLDNYNFNLLESYSNITEAYIKSKNYPIAKKYLDSTKALINVNSDAELTDFYYELLFRYNFRTNKDEEVLMTEYNTLVKENKKRYEEKLEEDFTAYKLLTQKEQLAVAQKNKAEIDKLKLLGLSEILSLLIIIGYLVYRQRKFRFEKESLKIQQRLLRTQLNPHFMFNTLSVIQNQIKSNGDVAANYLLKFSRLLRLILENSLNDYVQIEDELESLRKYLDLQLVRFPNKFSYTISTVNFEEDENLYIPPMLIQPFVENSIEHGFLGIDYSGEIDIKLTLENKCILCIIEDNGVGFIEANTKNKTSVSTRLISKFIHKTTKQTVDIIDKKTIYKDKTGIRIKFLIPYKFSQHD